MQAQVLERRRFVLELGEFLSQISLIRDYATALASAAKKWLWGFLAQGKPHKVSVLEAESFHRWHGSKNFAGKVIFLHIEGIPFDC
jgi:hypothetical protein